MTDTVIVATHRRSGTHWVIDSLRNNCKQVNDQFLNLDLIAPSSHSPVALSEFDRQLSALSGTVLIKSHTPASLDAFNVSDKIKHYAEKLVDQSKVIYVVRDGRDVLVSLYYYVGYYNKNVNKMSFSEFMRMPNDFDLVQSPNRAAFWRYHVESWLQSNHDVHIVTYESLHTNYEATMREIINFLDLEQPDKIQPIEFTNKKARERNNWQARLLRRLLKRSTKITSVQPRKGIVGDWRNHYDDADLEFFRQEAGDILRQLKK